MQLNLQQIPRVDTITKEDFIKHYFRTQKPVVIERFIEDWPAYSKWTLDYMKDVAGEKTVPLYDDRPVDYKDGFNEAHAKMRMSDYIDLLKREPTKFRIFLWNIFKEVPQLQKDFSYPDFGLKLMKKLPMLFFGGKDLILLCITISILLTSFIFILKAKSSVSYSTKIKISICTKCRIL